MQGSFADRPPSGSLVTAFRLYEPAELGRDGYAPEWHATLKHEVREQAGHRCVRCKHPYRSGEHGNGEWSRCDWQCSHKGPLRVQPIVAEQWHFIETSEDLAGDLVQNLEVPMFVEAAWRILTVHHLDGNKANCRWWNLAALCQRCHLEIQGRVRLERSWHGEHSQWFRPYVAGYYALRFLGEELTREQVEARLDELLALEHRQLAFVCADPESDWLADQEHSAERERKLRAAVVEELRCDPEQAGEEAV